MPIFIRAEIKPVIVAFSIGLRSFPFPKRLFCLSFSSRILLDIAEACEPSSSEASFLDFIVFVHSLQRTSSNLSLISSLRAFIVRIPSLKSGFSGQQIDEFGKSCEKILSNVLSSKAGD